MCHVYNRNGIDNTVQYLLKYHFAIQPSWQKLLGLVQYNTLPCKTLIECDMPLAIPTTVEVRDGTISTPWLTTSRHNQVTQLPAVTRLQQQ